jgi:hypothetical protein
MHLELFGDEHRTKYVWDGCRDKQELLGSCNVLLEGVIDLTIVNVVSRAARGEREEDKKGRLATHMHQLSRIKNLHTTDT